MNFILMQEGLPACVLNKDTAFEYFELSAKIKYESRKVIFIFKERIYIRQFRDFLKNNFPLSQTASSPVEEASLNGIPLIFRFAPELKRNAELKMIIFPAVTIWGSAREKEASRFYKLAEDLVYSYLVPLGFNIVTGGGPGIMEAANKGAHGRVISVGLNIDIPFAFEQGPNPYLNMSIKCQSFFARKLTFLYPTQGFAVFPGGFGAFDENTDILAFKAKGFFKNKPVVLVGREFYQGFMELLDIDKGLYYISDEPQEISEYLAQGIGLSLIHI